MILVLEAGRRAIRYSVFDAGNRVSIGAGSVDRCQVRSARDALARILSDTMPAGVRAGGHVLCAIAIRVPFGGAVFRAPTLVDARVIEALEDLTPRAPIHLPVVVALILACRDMLAGVPVAAVFDTAFFADLPAKEHLYAVNSDLSRSLQLRRFGYHGILHEAACSDLPRRGAGPATRILSVCLEPRPELAAVFDGRPVMVTGGATPLEGLPGERSSGDIDPSIPLLLAGKDGLGLEQINAILTGESGLFGLVGEPVTLRDVFRSDEPAHCAAREVFRYRLLLAAGAAKAALNGIDAIVFSGKYHELGGTLGPWLASRLLPPGAAVGSIGWSCFADTAQRLIAVAAEALLAHQPSPARGPVRR